MEESENPFISTLMTQYSDILDHAVSHNYIVCVPVAPSLERSKFNRRFFSKCYAVDHMLKPSPYVENLFQSLRGKHLIIKNDEIRSHTGYHHKFIITKLKEENSYDPSGRCYKQITLSAPLDDSENKNVRMKPDPIFKFYTAKEYIGFLEFAVENAEAATMYGNAFTTHFNNSYIIFKEFMRDCYDKVRQATSDLKQIIVRIPQFVNASRNQKMMGYINELVESNVLHKIYDKLFTHISQYQDTEEKSFRDACEKLLKNLPPDKFGFDAELQGCTFEKSALVFQKINEATTTWSKLEVLTRLATSIEKECKEYLMTQNQDKAEKWEMSADQYFPLLTYFLTIQPVPNLLANVSFINELSICLQNSGEQKYHFTNLMAAVQSIQDMAEDLAKPTPTASEEKPPHQNKKRIRFQNTPNVITLNEELEEGVLEGEEQPGEEEEEYGVFGPPSRRF